MIKEFILEYEDGLKQIVFFSITLVLFSVATIHALKMKRSLVKDYAKLALDEEGEKKDEH